mgnify:FL=1
MSKSRIRKSDGVYSIQVFHSPIMSVIASFHFNDTIESRNVAIIRARWFVDMYASRLDLPEEEFALFDTLRNSAQVATDKTPF